MILIYKYTSPSNKCYIGQTKKTLVQRAGWQGSQYERCTAFWRAIQKYGWDNFKSEILEAVETEDEANEKEKYYIELYKSNQSDYGYNIYSGGDVNNDYEYTQRLKDIKEMWDNGCTVGDIQKKYNLKQQTLSYELKQLGIDGKERISRSAGKYLARRTCQYDLDFNLIKVYESAGQAEKETGITNIRRSCKNNEGLEKPKYKSGNYYWVYE